MTSRTTRFCKAVRVRADPPRARRDERHPRRRAAAVGRRPVALAPDLVAIPVPGHTRGHAVLLYRDRRAFHSSSSARLETQITAFNLSVRNPQAKPFTRVRLDRAEMDRTDLVVGRN